MKCLNCGQENKDKADDCRKCGRDLSLPPAWFPDWKWHIKTLTLIYCVLIVVFFVAKFSLHKLPPPYHLREIKPEVTPWLNPEVPPVP